MDQGFSGADVVVRPFLFPLGEASASTDEANRADQAPGDSAQADRVAENESEENADVICIRPPVRPTAQMIEEHEVCHIPFRAWCSSCVRARGASCGHPEVQKQDE